MSVLPVDCAQKASVKMRLLVVGPEEFEDYQFVRDRLDHLTFELDDVVLVTDNPSSFPLAQKWFTERWKKSKGKRFRLTRVHHVWDCATRKDQLVEMVRDATGVVAFWDVGSVDATVEEVWRLAKVYDLKTRKVLV